MIKYEELEAYIYGKKIGTLIHDKNRIYFKYDEKFSSYGLEISPLKLPLSDTTLYTNEELFSIYNGLPGVIHDSLPDKHGMHFIDGYFQKKGINKAKITLLHKLAFIGDRGMGAIEYFPKEEDEKTIVEKVLDAKKTYEDIKQSIQKESKVSIADLLNTLSSVSPAGGMRPKMLISYNSTTKEMMHNNSSLKEGFIRAIIKFDEVYEGVGSIDLTKLEYIYMSMAKKAGINTCDFYPYEENGEFHLIVKRFDRDSSDDKIHMASASALMHKDVNIPQSMSYEELLKFTGYICRDKQMSKEILKRMIFNTMAFNYDDHSKNFSFLMNRSGEWSITPAYDITYSVGMLKEHATTINTKGKDFIRDDFYTVADLISVSKKEIDKMINDIKIALKDFEFMAYDLKIDETTIRECKENIDFQMGLLEE